MLFLINIMSHFPVSNSNLSAAHLAIFVADQYGFSDKTACNLIRAGINDTYLVAADEQRYVFRVYSLDWRTEKEIREEIRLLLLLQKNNIAVSYPLADKKGELFRF